MGLMKISFQNKFPGEGSVVCVPVYSQEHLETCDIYGYTVVPEDLALLEETGFLGKKGTFRSLLTKESKVLFYGLGKKDELKEPDLYEIGAKLLVELKALKQKKAVVLMPASLPQTFSEVSFVANIAYGLKLRTYDFSIYKTSKKEPPFAVEAIDFVVESASACSDAFQEKECLVEGIQTTLNLVNEPPNILYPETFADRIKELESYGIKVTVLDEKDLKEKGLNAILAVGNGSEHKPRLAIMEWTNGPEEEKPLAFVGKGVTFDTGGISLKPSARMEEMKYDMTGAAVVTGLMKVLALRNAKVNVVGLVGLAENSPDGAAYRPSDIIKTYSGQTIEVTNTDAEGRVVLSDVLAYAEKNYDPKFIIDLATLTGAIIIALGTEYAGLFSNDDTLADKLNKAGAVVNEKVWRMPMCDAYDRLIDSKVADVDNSGPRDASSATAAHFLKRFVKNCPWVHLDIAGVSSLNKVSPLTGLKAYGYGVNLLNTLIKTYYEKADHS